MFRATWAVLKAFIGASCLALALGAAASAENGAYAPNPAVKPFFLENGMLFLVVERPVTPQVACRLAIRAGSAFEDSGSTGIAHMLEHMMFKGTRNFGSLDPDKDRELQERIEAAYQAVLAEEGKRNPDRDRIREKRDEMDRLRAEVQRIFVPQAFSAQLSRNGAIGINAFTSKDETQYMASVPSDMLEQWFSIISEQVFEPAWREFYVEKEVVQREWAFRYGNRPEGAAWLDLHATAYQAHPYRNPTMGWPADMEKFSTWDAAAFHGKYYAPANAVCVLVGDVTLEQARRLAHVYFGRYPAGERSTEIVTAEPPQEGIRRSIRYLKGARTPVVRVGFPAAPMGTDDFYALDALTMVLSQGRGARFTRNLVDKGLAVEAWAANPDNRFGGMLVLGGTASEPEWNDPGDVTEAEMRRAYVSACEDLEKRMVDELERLKTELVSDEELDRIRKLHRHDFLRDLRSNEALARTLATLEVKVGWDYLTSYLRRMDLVKAEDIRRVAGRYGRMENRTSVYVVPGGEPVQPVRPYTEVRSMSGAAAAEVRPPTDFRNRSIHPTPDGWKHPFSFQRQPGRVSYPIAETESVEGAAVFFLADRGLPLMDLKVFVKAGSVDVPDRLSGLATLLSRCLIRGGTEIYSPAGLAMELDRHAIRLSLSVGEEETTIGLSVMKEEWERGITLLEEVLARPRFDSGILEVAKQEAIAELRRQGGDALTVARREGMIWHFKGHPYGRDPLMGLHTIPGITRDDLLDFFRARFVPSNMVIAVSGDMEREEAMRGVARLVQTLRRGDAPPRDISAPEEAPPVLAIIHKPGQVQSQVVFLLPGVKRTHPAYWKLTLLSRIFGGSDSLLYTRLRDELGLVYSAWFHGTFKWEAGILMGYMGSQAERTDEAIEEAVRLMEGLRREVPEHDLRQKRLDALNSFVFNVDTPGELVSAYARYAMRGEPLDTLDRIQDAYMEASRSELEELAGRFLNPRDLRVIVVADRNTRMKGTDMTLDVSLRELAGRLGLPYQEMELR